MYTGKTKKIQVISIQLHHVTLKKCALHWLPQELARYFINIELVHRICFFSVAVVLEVQAVHRRTPDYIPTQYHFETVHGAGGRFPQIRTDAQLSATVWLQGEEWALQLEARGLFLLFDDRRYDRTGPRPITMLE